MKIRAIVFLTVFCSMVVISQSYSFQDPFLVTTDLSSLKTAPDPGIEARIEFVLDDFTDANFEVQIDNIIFSADDPANNVVYNFEDGTTQGFSGDPMPATVRYGSLNQSGKYYMQFTDDPAPGGSIISLVLNNVTLPNDVNDLSFILNINQYGDVFFDAVVFHVFLLTEGSSSNDPFPTPLIDNTPIIYSYNIFNNENTYNPIFTDVIAIPEPVTIASLLFGIIGLIGIRKRVKNI